MTNKPSFRYDINGLRAIAVIAVMIFHYDHSWLSGGFTGVDVFFVISGYLMTSIILKGLENNSFSFIRFYKARAQRIIPALITICIILACLGYILFEPMTYQLLGKHIVVSLLFISNIAYYRALGYFEIIAQYKFLLHTWSLSVEWQFYILYPIFLAILYRFIRLKTLKIIILIVTIISFGINIYYTYTWPTYAFYILPARIWELLIGSLAFLYPLHISNKNKKNLEIIGLLTIFLSFVFITNKAQESAGYFLIFPVLGAYSCILANNQKTILRFGIIQKIGLISYSLYLVHWPLIVFYKIENIHLSFYMYVLCTILFSVGIYFFIERKRTYKYKTIFTYLSILLCGYYISIDGVANRVKNPTYKQDYTHFFLEYYGGVGIPNDAHVTHFNNNGHPPSFIISGDSHARQYGKYFSQNHHNFIGIFHDGCMAMPNLYIDPIPDKHDPAICPKTFTKLKNILDQNPKASLIIIHRWDIYNMFSPTYYNPNDPNKKATILEALPNEIKQLIAIGGSQRQYFLVGQSFQSDNEENIFQCYAKQQLFFYKKILSLSCKTNVSQKEQPASILLKKIAAQYPNVHFIDPNDVLCKQHQCSLIDQKQNPILSDKDHLSIYGANIVGKYIIDTINGTK